MSRLVGLSIQGLTKSFGAGRDSVLAGVDLDVYQGETVALIGRSGAGKSTLARCLVGLESSDSGSILLGGAIPLPPRTRQARRLVQMVWQDPYSALSPYRSVRDSIREPLDAFAIGDKVHRTQHVTKLAAEVGLPPNLLERRPHQLSGGECQRVVIARALAPEPQLLVLDEPLSALDAHSQAAVLPVLRAIARNTKRVVLLISHDLTAVRSLADRIAMLHEGRIVEIEHAASFLAAPQHDASRAFLAAWPSLPFRNLNAER